MREILTSIKNVFIYGKKTIAYTWLFFFVMSILSDSPHNIFVIILLSGLFTFILIIIAATMRYFKII